MKTSALFAMSIIALAGNVQAQLTLRTDTSANPAGLAPVYAQFKADLGTGIIRELNWDGVPATSATPNALPPNFFNVSSPRGVVLTTPGTSVQVSGSPNDSGPGQPAAIRFHNLNISYSFLPFTELRLFSPIGSNIVDVNFFVAGTSIPAAVSGFGAVFCDVDLSNTTSVQFFDRAGSSMGVFFVPPISSGLSFLGGFTTDRKPTIARVRITEGNTIIGANENGATTDVVVSDDFIYSDPTDRIFGNGFD